MHPKGILTFCVAIALITVALPAWAQVKEGDKEISVFGSIQNVDIENLTDITIVTLQLSGGLFISANNQVGGSFLQQSVSTEFGDQSTRVFSGFFKHHVNPQDVAVPYIGAQFGMAFVEFAGESESSASYGGMAGLKYFVSEDLSVNGEFSMVFSEVDIYDVTTNTFQVGLSYYF